jgi:mycothiol synthase
MWVVDDADGAVVAIGAVRGAKALLMQAYVGVLPEHRGKGIGSHLLELVEKRADERIAEAAPGTEVTLDQTVGQLNPEAGSLLEAGGYSFVRRFWQMGIDLSEDPPEPVWPEGARLETLVPGNEHEVYEVLTDAFRDHWGFVEFPYDEWRAWMVEREAFDPSLWLLVREGDRLLGASLLRVRENGAGWVNVLGVAGEHRRRGLGLALLLQSLRELRRRGLERAGLDVDSENLTGATRLYERAGMHVVRHADTFRKILRPADSA